MPARTGAAGHRDARGPEHAQRLLHARCRAEDYRGGTNGLAQPSQELEGQVGLVYGTPSARDERLAEFVGTGLQRGEQVVLMAGADDRRWEAPPALHGLDTGGAAREGSLATLDRRGSAPPAGRWPWWTGCSRPDARGCGWPRTPRRLDALQAALWDEAMAGDVDAAGEVRAIIIARCYSV